MAGNTYVNGREICGKASSGSSMAAFPDVCLSPPGPPAGPVPVPYAVTAKASDTTNGSVTVLVDGKPVMLKDKSYFACCTGDEASTDSFGRSVITHQKRGKVYFVSWSLDVMIEGLNAVRHLDLCTHNHASKPGSTPPWPYLGKANQGPPKPGAGGPCATERRRVNSACDDPPRCPDVHKPQEPQELRHLREDQADLRADDDDLGVARVQRKIEAFKEGEAYRSYRRRMQAYYQKMQTAIRNDPCQRAKRCELRPYSPNKCCPGQTPHHLIEASSFYSSGRYPTADNRRIVTAPPGKSDYDTNKAPCICVEGASNTDANHGRCHTIQGYRMHLLLKNQSPDGYHVTYKQARENGIRAIREVFKSSGCSEACLRRQLDNYHKGKCGMVDSTPVRGSPSGWTSKKDFLSAQHELKEQGIARKKSTNGSTNNI
jgi:hypothetical protein